MTDACNKQLLSHVEDVMQVMADGERVAAGVLHPTTTARLATALRTAAGEAMLAASTAPNATEGWRLMKLSDTLRAEARGLQSMEGKG